MCVLRAFGPNSNAPITFDGSNGYSDETVTAWLVSTAMQFDISLFEVEVVEDDEVYEDDDDDEPLAALGPSAGEAAGEGVEVEEGGCSATEGAGGEGGCAAAEAAEEEEEEEEAGPGEEEGPAGLESFLAGAGGLEYLAKLSGAGIKSVDDLAGKTEVRTDQQCPSAHISYRGPHPPLPRASWLQAGFAELGVAKMKVRKLLAKALRQREAEL